MSNKNENQIYTVSAEQMELTGKIACEIAKVAGKDPKIIMNESTKPISILIPETKVTTDMNPLTDSLQQLNPEDVDPVKDHIVNGEYFVNRLTILIQSHENKDDGKEIRFFMLIATVFFKDPSLQNEKNAIMIRYMLPAAMLSKESLRELLGVVEKGGEIREEDEDWGKKIFEDTNEDEDEENEEDDDDEDK